MINDVHNRLVDWAGWRLTRFGYRYRTVLGDLLDHRGAVGGMGGAPSESRTTGAPAPSRELLDLHRAVIALPPTLQRTVLLYYAHCCTLAGLDRQALDPEVAAAHRAITIPAIAEILNCEQRTIYNRLHSAHTQILVLLRQFDAARRPLHPRSRRAGLGSVRQVRSPRGT